jgi:hypothetical protein
MKPFVIVVDYKYYIENEQDINQWCDQCIPGWKLTGMIVEFKSEEDRLAFLLRWD